MLHTLTARFWTAGVCIVGALLLSGCDDIHDTMLDNGMRVIVKEDHRSPTVATMVWYKVGGMDEPKGLTGMSHVLEHMMFQGTERLEPNEFSRIIAEQGGRENAFTSYDYTAYFQQLEKSRLPIAFELEAERMRNLRLREAEFEKEIQVVMEERRLRTDDRPEALVYERLMNEAYKAHPYRHPIIGWMEDLRRITVNDLRDWYAQWYRPNNAVLVVVGDVEPTQVVQLAKKHFGGIAAEPFARSPIPEEPPQQQTRRVAVRVPAQVPYLLMGYHVPVHVPENVKTPDQEPWEAYALSVLAGVLDGGQSARFERELVREQKIAASIGTSYDPIARSPTMMFFSGTPAAGHDVESLEQAIRAQIERVKKEPVTPEELERVKAQVIASDVFQRDSVFYQAMQLGQLAMVGLDLNLLEQRVRRLSAVTPEQVRAVARKYLTADNLTVVTLDPVTGESDNNQAPTAKGGANAR